MKELTRREFVWAAGAAAAGTAWAGSGSGARWWKGMLHAHSLRSDGRVFPEEAVAFYRDRGYDFFSLTDHNRAGVNRDDWREVIEKSSAWPPKVTKDDLARYRAAFGDAVETREVNGKLQVRLKSFAENAARFNVPGKFLLMPGMEATDAIANGGCDVHVNVVNSPRGVPSREDKFLIYGNPRTDVSGWIADTYREAAKAAGARRFLFTVNHPCWRYWPVLPQDVMDNADLRFFELINNDCSEDFKCPDWLTLTQEQFWDVVNAHRCARGLPLMYANGTDDTHTYFEAAKSCFGGAWIHVRSASLDADALIAAMDAGDFYVSNGVELAEVDFDRREKRLTVAVKPENGVTYSIRFLVTKKNFDHRVEYRELKLGHIGYAERGTRKYPVYPAKTFGVVAKAVAGTAASYQMADDDLYVRAEVTSDRASRQYLRRNWALYHPKKQGAWTQPYR